MELLLLQYDALLRSIGVNVILGLSMYLCLKAGAFSLAQVGVAGVTAYTSAMISIKTGLPIIPSLIVGAVLGAVVSLLINTPALRLRSVYLAIATLSFTEIVRVAALNLEVTGGPLGLRGITADATVSVIGVCVLLAVLAAALVDSSRFGRSLDALRLDEDAAKALGIVPSSQLLKTFALSGALAGIAGVLFAHKSSVITPSNFSFTFATLILTIVIVGGVSHWAGSVIAAILLTALPSLLAGTSLSAGWPQLLVQGVLTLLVVFFYPVGISAAFLPLRRWLYRRHLVGEAKLPEFTSTAHTPWALEARDVSRAFGGVEALTGVSLGVALGKVTGLIGPNGAGKTTLVNQLNGADIPTSGEVLVDGDRVEKPSMASFALRRITRTFQHTRVFDEMTLLENVEIGLFLDDRARISQRFFAPLKSRRIDRQRRLVAMALLEQVGLSDRVHMKASALSYGQKRRLEIARALAVNPQVLMLDEPAAGMNAREKTAIIELIKQIRAQGRGLLVIEHDLELVRQVSDRLYLLNTGKILLDGDTDEVLDSPETIDAYVGGQNQEREFTSHATEKFSADTGLVVRGLTAGYGPIEVLHEIDLAVPRGSTVAVLGSNGAGKSTLLKAICGVIRPTGGQITFDGKDVTRWPAHRKVKELGIMLVPETRAIVSHLSVYENLLTGYRGGDGNSKPVRELVEEMYRMFPILETRAQQRGDTLSGGEQQMLAIARALMAEPEILVLDEPSTGLAPKIVRQVTDSIAEISKSGTTVLWVEQSVSDALALSSFAYVLELGKVRISGQSNEVAQNPTLIGAYLSDSGPSETNKEDNA